MKLIRTVVVKQILTKKRKEHLLQKLEEEETQYEKELEQLTFQLHKNQKTHQGNQERSRKVRQSYKEEIRQREEKIRSVQFKRHQLHKLQLGSELKDGTIQSLCEVKTGDVWDNILTQSEIIIKDGIIHEIREGRNDDDKLV
ncbi:YlqD family protein [Alkalihalobacillus sp. LMS39]|uniref:YlqD family protein n=1 Tax=Alkalihalobacillus sp. LMS39 TaxID=2924032 RepID=UPI001FB40D86|nr:YlqD family protein [Alkalihalobacillus sp. LMS39]UOE92864.1 YlqD family protein [Alkalihalobacillus sp. LMS39]